MTRGHGDLQKKNPQRAPIKYGEDPGRTRSLPSRAVGQAVQGFQKSPGCFIIVLWKQDQAFWVERQSQESMQLSDKLREEKIRQLPLRKPIVVTTETPISDVIRGMKQQRRSCVLVENQGKIQGLITERDILVKHLAAKGAGSESAKQIMTTSIHTLSPEDTLAKAIRVMTEGGYRHIPLAAETGKILGLLSARDIVDYIAEHFPAEVLNLPPRPEQKISAAEGA